MVDRREYSEAFFVMMSKRASFAKVVIAHEGLMELEHDRYHHLPNHVPDEDEVRLIEMRNELEQMCMDAEDEYHQAQDAWLAEPGDEEGPKLDG